MTYILYLAAGSARRFGANKLLAMLDGQPLYRHGLAMLCGVAAARADCCLQVVSRYAPILDAAADFGAVAVPSPLSEQGLSHTIRAGVQSLGSLSEQDFLLFVAADQPWLRGETVQRLLDAALPGTQTACAACNGSPGNPVLFAARYAPALCALQGDEGGRVVIRRNALPCRLVPVCDAKELRDIDLPTQL